MVKLELVKMSLKGQLVVPREIREREKFKPSDRFIPFYVKEGVLFKKVKIPDVKIEFKSLVKEIETQFRKEKISESDVKEAVKWARRG